MKRRLLTVCVLAAVVLAGCTGATGTQTPASDGETNATATETPPAETGATETETSVDPAAVPGVDDGSLTNATALAAANRDIVVDRGGIVETVQNSATNRVESRLTLGAGLDTLRTERDIETEGGSTGTQDIWANDTVYIRTIGENGPQYRTTERGAQEPTLTNGILPRYLAAGAFTVAPDAAAGDGRVVLTADDVAQGYTGEGELAGLSAFEGRLVVGADGLVQEFSMNATAEGGELSYRYDLVQAGVDRAPKPDWVAEVPTATLGADLRVSQYEVEEDSYLLLRNDGSEAVPAGARVIVESGGGNVTGTATLAAPFGEDPRYVFFADDELRVSTTQPGENAQPLSSPVSVTVVSAEGQNLLSASLAWGSASAGESTAGGSGGGGSSETAG
jgi:hypothetical protein